MLTSLPLQHTITPSKGLRDLNPNLSYPLSKAHNLDKQHPNGFCNDYKGSLIGFGCYVMGSMLLGGNQALRKRIRRVAYLT